MIAKAEIGNMSEKPTYEDLQRRIQDLEKAEFERKKTEQAQRESEESFRQVYRQISVGVARVSLESQIEGANE
jgi:PAS domain-containing protein